MYKSKLKYKRRYKRGGPIDVEGTTYLPVDYNRPFYTDEEGNKRSEYKITISDDRGSFVIPTVWDGKQYTNDEAIERFRKTGEHMGAFANDTDAERGSKLRTFMYNNVPQYNFGGNMKKKKKLRGLKYASTPNLPYFEDYSQYGFGGWLKENAGTIGGVAGGLIGSFVAPGVGTAIGGSLGSAIGKGIQGTEEEETILPQHVARRQPLTASTNVSPMGRGGCMPCLKHKVFARGGRVQGGFPGKDLTTYEGPLHSDMEGGIPIGQDTMVEGGEARSGDIIHSDKIKITRPLVKRFGRQYGGPVDINMGNVGISVADRVKQVDSKFDRYPGDMWSEQSRSITRAPFDYMSELIAGEFGGNEEGYDSYGNYGDASEGIQQMGKGGKWIQKATASIKRRGTAGKCTPMTKPGCTGRALALAKTFHKMARNRKKKQYGGPYSIGDGYAVPGEMPNIGVVQDNRPKSFKERLNRALPAMGSNTMFIPSVINKEHPVLKYKKTISPLPQYRYMKTTYPLPRKNKAVGGDILGAMPLVGSAINIGYSLFDKPEEVNYPKINYEEMTPTFLDPSQQMQEINSTYAGATEGIRRTSPQNYLNRISALSSGRTRATSELAEKYGIANASISNEMKEQNKRYKTYVDVRNAEIARMEEIDRARNEQARDNAIMGSTSNLFTQAGQVGRDINLREANEEYNKSYFDFLNKWGEDMYGKKEGMCSGGRLKKLSRKRKRY